ncbi:MAG: carboxypeptidase-like regulatory domain-containing protein [bacterium]|nr:carboxypeptidase-like regulatory domain-containing protein [bacterium]
MNATTRNFLFAFLFFSTLFVTPLKGDGTGVSGQTLFRGKGLSGVYVQAFAFQGESSEAAGAANTGSDGVYHIPLAPGSYRITARKRPEGPGSGGMLFASTGDIPVVVNSGSMELPPLILTDSGGAGSAGTGETRVTGAVFSDGAPLAGAYVYFYPGSVRRGPGYVARARTGEGGNYEASLSPGSYTVTVRFGWSGDGMGTVDVGDLVGEYPGSPLAVGKEAIDLGRLDTRPVDRGSWEKYRWAVSAASITVEGVVRDENRSPLAGAYVFLYADHRMVGKPYAISPPTARDGRYSLSVDTPGTYYLGARTRFGGPVEPGEFMGAWGGDSAEPLVLEIGTSSPSLDITVREVW